MGKKTFVNDEAELKWTGERYMLPGRVGARIGVTKNLGDYNSLVIQFWQEDNVGDTETAEEASERVYRAVESRVGAAIEEYED